MKVTIIYLLLCCLPTIACGVTNKIHVIDVGEGQAILLQQGQNGTLIDTGHFGKVSNLISIMRNEGVDQLDRIYLTHLHADHASGIFGMMNQYDKALIFESGKRYPFDPCEDASRWVEQALDDGRWKVSTLSQGDTQHWRGFSLKVLWPHTTQNTSRNEDSLVLLVSFGEHTLLVMGDATKVVEKKLIEQDLLPENIDVLVVGHHGTSDATSALFVDEINPVYGVISINPENDRGYPAQKVVNMLIEKGVVVHNTSKDGGFTYPF